MANSEVVSQEVVGHVFEVEIEGSFVEALAYRQVIEHLGQTEIMLNGMEQLRLSEQLLVLYGD